MVHNECRQAINEYKFLRMYYYPREKKKEKPLPLFDSAGVKVKRKTNLTAKLDKVFSRFIRLRDAMPNGYFKCISCGRVLKIDEADCGHFYSRKHMATRFDEDNAHAECRACNRFSADHLIAYQTNLIKKIGMSRFELLGQKAHQTKKWSDFELDLLIKHYKQEADRMASEKRINL